MVHLVVLNTTRWEYTVNFDRGAETMSRRISFLAGGRSSSEGADGENKTDWAYVDALTIRRACRSDADECLDGPWTERLVLPN